MGEARKQKQGIILANTGTPSSPDAASVRKYLSQFLMNKRIVPCNRVAWWLLLNACILPFRSGKSAQKYEGIWTKEGSPFLTTHEVLAAGLQDSYRRDGYENIVVSLGMSFGEPSMRDAFSTLKSCGCETITVLPLFPQSAYSNTGIVFDGIEEALSKLKWDAECSLIDNYHDNDLYIRTIAASIKRAGFKADSSDRVLFSFHSIPLVDVERGDTYELQCKASSRSLAHALGIPESRWTIGYQSRFDKKRPWLEPSTTEVLEEWSREGRGRIFLVCPGFSVDCLETLHDVYHDLIPCYREGCARYGNHENMNGITYVPCLGKTKAHVEVLRQILKPYIEER